MIRIFALIALFVGVALSRPSLAEEPAAIRNCPLTQLASVDLISMPNGVVLVPATLNGQPLRVRLALENGSTFLTREAARKAGFNVDRVDRALKVKAGQFAIGKAGYTKFDFILVDPGSAVEWDAVMGLNAFNNVDVEIDLAQGKLNIFSQAHCQGVVVYWDERFDVIPFQRDRSGQMSLVVELDGRLVSAAISVSGTSRISENLTRAIFGFDRESSEIERVSRPNGEDSVFFRSMEIQSHGLGVMNARVQLWEDPVACKVKFRLPKNAPIRYSNCEGLEPFVLGGDILSRMRIYLAMKERKMYFTVNKS